MKKMSLFWFKDEGEQCDKHSGSLKWLRGTPSWLPAKKQGPWSHSHKELNYVKNVNELGSHLIPRALGKEDGHADTPTLTCEVLSGRPTRAILPTDF